MKKSISKAIIAATLLAVGAFCMSSCHTIRGAGRDVEGAGRAVERAAS